MRSSLLFAGLWWSAVYTTAAPTSSARGLDSYITNPAGNPFIDAHYADPDSAFYDGQYWVYPTTSTGDGSQRALDAFSSPDLINWTKHPNILTSANFPWARRSMWAPSPIQRNGKYYLYFSANDLQAGSSPDSVGGIGVGVADRPEGPYKDPLGHPLISPKDNNYAELIDQDIFLDDDGQAYIYYGGHGRCVAAKVNSDVISLGRFADGTAFKTVVPSGQQYVEGPKMLKRNGIYYLFWSEGFFGDASYSVGYGMSDSPLGPFYRVAKILQTDPAIGTGPGHNGVIHVPGTDTYYMLYHRHPLNGNTGAQRFLAYDRMYFNSDNTIQPIKMLVHDNFEDANMIGWTVYDGSYTAAKKHLSASSSFGGKALLNTNFADFNFEADITIPNRGTGDAGLVFRASNPGVGVDNYSGYYAGISGDGYVTLGRANRGWTLLKRVGAGVEAGRRHVVRVRGVGDVITVYVDDMDEPKISLRDGTYKSGMNGVRVYRTAADFDNVKIDHV